MNVCDLRKIPVRRRQTARKTEDTREFLRPFWHLLKAIDRRSNVHSIPHHQKPLLHSSNSWKERLGSAQISISCDTKRK